MNRTAAALLALGLLLSGVAAPAVALDEGDSASFHFAVAKLYAADGEIEAALEAFEKAVELDPVTADLQVEYANFLASQRRLEQAAAVVGRALEGTPDHPGALRLSGQIHWVLSRSDESSLEIARASLERLREIAPEDIVGLATLAQLYERTGRLDSAVEIYRELVAGNTDNQQLKRMLIDALNRAGRIDEARTELREIVELEQASTENRIRLAELEAQKGDPEQAIRLLREGGEELQRQPAVAEFLAGQLVELASSPGISGEQRRSNLEEGLNALRVVPAEQRGRRMTELEARILRRLTRSDEAIEALKAARNRVADEVWPSFLLARELGRVGDAGAASTVLEAALDRFGDDREVRQQLLDELIQVDANRDAWDRALDWSARLLDSVDAPVRPYALERRAVVLASSGNVRQALKLLRREYRGDDFDFDVKMLEVRLLLIGERKEEAQRILRSGELAGPGGEADFATQLALAGLEFEAELAGQAKERIDGLLEDANLEQRLAVGQFYSAAGRFDLAVPVLRSGEQLAVERVDLRGRGGDDEGAEQARELLADARFLFAQSLERTDQVDDAARVFRQVLRQRPDDTVTMNYLGYMLAEADQELDAALELIERAVELRPDNGSYVDSLGWVLFRLGRLDEALEQLQRANRLSPGNAVILEHVGDAQRALGRDREALASYRAAEALDDPENLEIVQRKLAEVEQAIDP